MKKDPLARSANQSLLLFLIQCLPQVLQKIMTGLMTLTGTNSPASVLLQTKKPLPESTDSKKD